MNRASAFARQALQLGLRLVADTRRGEVFERRAKAGAGFGDAGCAVCFHGVGPP